MSEIITDLAWFPPAFPVQGRLPAQAALVGANCAQQDSHELAYRQALCLAVGRRVEPTCCKTLHISLFFDGTGNNLNHDLYIADPKHPTNIARLFRVTIGQGAAGGVSKGEELLDADGSGEDKYYKYYIPGVGTPFPEVNDLDFSMMGLAAATHGEERINWGLLRLIDALKRTMTRNSLSDDESWKAVDKMATSMASFGLTGSANRFETFQHLLKDMLPELQKALMPTEPGKPKLLGIKLYVYGFSRGAAAARAFVRWLSELLPKPAEGQDKPEQCLAVGGLKIPLSVEFLGLLDTVASVGVAHIAPVAEGHMGWADGTQELPAEKTYGGLIKKCVHLVSSHEQRLCFPLDSIRRPDGKYPANSEEVVYPGMHSDLGGGYPPGDQGKANGSDDGLLLSQIALNDLFSAAFSSGAPFKLPEECLPPDLKKDIWRRMSPDLLDEFFTDSILINRFNAWRELTLGLSSPTDPLSPEQAAKYDPPRAPVSLEKAIENQLGWITAWRINRYAGGSYKTQRFYVDSAANGLDKDSDPLVRKQSEAARKALQKEIDDVRRDMKAQHNPEEGFLKLPPGPKDFDAALGQTQLRQAAEEFREDYHGLSRTSTGNWFFTAADSLSNAIFLMNNDDEYGEWLRIKTAGDDRVKVLFPISGEASNATQPAGLVRALFDDQVHDSRAWFMHNAFDSREPWGSYFLYRMIYFGSRSSKPMTPLMIAGAVVGVATLAAGAAVIIKQKSAKGKLAGLAGTVGAIYLETQAIDLLSGKPLSMLPNAAQLQAPTMEPGVVVAQQTQAIGEQRLALAKSLIESGWAEKLKSTVTA
ncbi:T6SS phospholipase effector Tle1-like catalytic domain-containing protein [Serratia sp. NPDC087055]|uniref:T6SS phospholipase effector Tle1-like catalytic domain-containing protein n=1 Tax=Serratia sp. NPDC087055 TaxID=3364516 RepID=UPI00384B076A